MNQGQLIRIELRRLLSLSQKSVELLKPGTVGSETLNKLPLPPDSAVKPLILSHDTGTKPHDEEILTKTVSEDLTKKLLLSR